MEKHDWLSVGLKLLGIYFGVTGLVTLWGALLAMMTASRHGGPAEDIGPIGILSAGLYLGIAFVLVRRTGACLCWCTAPEPERPA